MHTFSFLFCCLFLLPTFFVAPAGAAQTDCRRQAEAQAFSALAADLSLRARLEAFGGKAPHASDGKPGSV